MFTGLVEEVGIVRELERLNGGIQMAISSQIVIQDLSIGDSVAVDGVCLTATRVEEDRFYVEAMPETISKSNMQRLRHLTPVHLERALAVGDRLGGHFVQGHVDGTAQLVQRIPEGNSVRFLFQAKPALTHWMITKGSIAISGVSLTLVEVTEETFSVSIIPHTLAMTHLGQLQAGDRVNIECDMVGKYIAKWATLPEFSVSK